MLISKSCPLFDMVNSSSSISSDESNDINSINDKLLIEINNINSGNSRYKNNNNYKHIRIYKILAKSFINIDNIVDLRKIKIELRINKKYPIYYQYRTTEIVAKKYQIIKIIGKGKFGIVFKVYNFIDKKNYALKMVRIYNSSTARSAVYENQMYKQINKLVS